MLLLPYDISKKVTLRMPNVWRNAEIDSSQTSSNIKTSQGELSVLAHVRGRRKPCAKQPMLRLF